MSHDVHLLPRRVLGDDCDECVQRAAGGLGGLAALDSVNLAKLAGLAAEIKLKGFKPDDASWADARAVETLRLAARIVFASGITVEVRA